MKIKKIPIVPARVPNVGSKFSVRKDIFVTCYNKQQTTNNKQQMTNDKQTNNKQQMTNNK